jgi:predicted RNA-binding Zn-ribbon protein involved in translation (DUF1610 family)
MEAKKIHSWGICGNTVTVLFGDGIVKTITRDHKYALSIIQMLMNNVDPQGIWNTFDRAAALNRTIETIDIELGRNRLTGKLENGKIFVRYNDEVIGGPVVDKIIEFMDEGLPTAPLAKFLMRLMNNPSYNSRQQLYSFLDALKMPITCEGTFLACKGVNMDYTDCHTGTINNRPGATIPLMQRSEVDDNPNNHCSHGYHCGSWDYAKSFGARVVLVEVDPADVVSVPSDHNAQKCRVTWYKVLADMLEPIKGPLKDVNPPAVDEEDDDDDEVVCPKCGGDAMLSDDGSVIISACNPGCDRNYTCANCNEVLKTTEDNGRPRYCPECGEWLDYS